jgi:hypothetical protein|tara:strand:- start:13 stop:789 length:777 start_codon:yes stop_codon:yes gene_type:complete
VNIYKPIGGSHGGDTFRELLDMWAESGYCNLRESPDDYVWVEEPGNILLFDYPRIDDRPIPEFKTGLFGNTVPNNPQCKPWIFWGRKPREIEVQRQQCLSYDERSTLSIFLGKIENNIQYNNRTTYDWSSQIEKFTMPISNGPAPYPYTQIEYLNEIKNSKFGLTLPGYGPKCNREIEYLAMGTVPIFIDGCDTTYHNPLIENVHYIKVSEPDEIPEKINDIDKNQWKLLSINGTNWYNANCSRFGSFAITKRIIDRI